MAEVHEQKMTPEERWNYFVEETSRCIRCYACRNACPVCYCSECFVDSTMPYWIGTTLVEDYILSPWPQRRCYSIGELVGSIK